MKLKVGDKVKWSGKYPKFINGWGKKEIHEFLESEDRKKMGHGAEFDKFIEENTVLVSKRGVGKIKSIEYNEIWGRVVITLNNGKMFTKEDNLKLVLSN